MRSSLFLVVLALGVVVQAQPNASLETVLIPPEGGDDNDQFGSSVALDGDRLAVAGEGDQAVHVFEFRDGTWVRVARLVAEVPIHPTAVELSGDRLLVAAPGDTSGTAVGAVYVYEYDGDEWNEAAVLRAQADDCRGFATTIAYAENTLVVSCPQAEGAHGAVQVFEYGGASGWTASARIAPGIDQYLHSEIDIDEGLITVVGTIRANNMPRTVVFVFERSANGWEEGPGIDVGSQLSLPKLAVRDNAIAIVSCVYSDGGALSVYRRRRDSSTWRLESHFDESIGDGICRAKAPAMTSNRIAVGTGSAVSLFKYNGKEWSEYPSVTRPSSIYFGTSVALHGDRLAVGDPSAAVLLTTQVGAADTYDLSDAVPRLEAVVLLNPGRSIDGVAREMEFSGSMLAATGGRVLTVFSLNSEGASTPTWSVAHQAYVRRTLAFEHYPSLAFSWPNVLIGAGGGFVKRYREAPDGWITDPELVQVSNPGYTPSVSLDGDHAAIGFSGATSGLVSFYDVANGAWTETPPPLARQDSESAAGFVGRTVVLRDGSAIVAAPVDHPLGVGRVTLFQRDNPTSGPWRFQRTVDVVADGEFGTAAAAGDGFFVVTAPNSSGPLGLSQSAYVFSAADLSPMGVLPAPQRDERTEFGRDVSASGSFVLIGAHSETVDGQPNAGAAYLFERTASGWSPSQRIVAPRPQTNGHFGYAVALGGSQAAIAAFRSGEPEYGGDAIYVYEVHAGSTGLTEAPSDSPRIQLAPNPAKHATRVTVWGVSENSAVAEIVDARGRVAQRTLLTLAGGSGTIELRLEDLVPGVYFLRLTQTNRLMRAVPFVVAR